MTAALLLLAGTWYAQKNIMTAALVLATTPLALLYFSGILKTLIFAFSFLTSNLKFRYMSFICLD
jgi:hypothetical protein